MHYQSEKIKTVFIFLLILFATLFSPVSNADFYNPGYTFKKDGASPGGYTSPTAACQAYWPTSPDAIFSSNSNSICGSADYHWNCPQASGSVSPPQGRVCRETQSGGTPANATCSQYSTFCTCNAGYTEVTSFLSGTSCEPISSLIDSPSSFAIGAGILGGALTTAMVGVASGTCAVNPMVCAGAIAAGALGGGMAAAAFRTSDNQTVIRKPDEGQPTSMELNLHLNGTAQTDTARAQNVGQGNLRPFNGSGASGTWEPHSSGASGTWENSGSWTNPSNGNVTSWNNFLDENNDSSWSSSTTSHAGGGGSLNNASLVAHNGDGTFDYFEYWEEWTNAEGTEKTAHILEATVASDGQATVTGGGQITFTWNGTSWIATGSGGGDGDGGDGDGGDGGDGGGDGEGDCATYGCAKESTLQQVLSQLQNTEVNASSVLTAVNSNAQNALSDIGDASNDALESMADDTALSDALQGLEELNYIGILSGDMGFGNCVPLVLDFESPGGAVFTESIDLCDKVDDIHMVLSFFLFLAFVMGVFELFTERPE